MMTDRLHVQCVYGDGHFDHLVNVFIPALKRTTSRSIRLLAINYDPRGKLRLQSGLVEGIEVVDVPNQAAEATGFAQNHNTLFRHRRPADSFVLLNPDCIPQDHSIDALLSRKLSREDAGKVAMVEGRQWPFEHLKEYDPLSLTTPWASGAFLLIDAGFYESVGGMDEIYFLYLEDVDLSWQAWLNGFVVLHEPAAPVYHFSGGPFARDDLVSAEEYLSLRNFLIISRKFFGEKGEESALALLQRLPDRRLAETAVAEYEDKYKPRIGTSYWGKKHPNVKILGLNKFHQWRQS